MQPQRTARPPRQGQPGQPREIPAAASSYTRSRSPTYSTEGIVVRLRDIGEADRLIWLITPDRGIIRCVAKSARKPTSRLGGHIDLLRHVTLSLRSGRTLDNVGQAETVSSFRGLHTDLLKASTGSYLAELAERFSVEGGASPQLFGLLVSALTHLEASPRPQALARRFEMRLLDLSGFTPQLDMCVECGQDLLKEERLLFSAARGGILCPRCRSGQSALLPASAEAIKFMRFLRTAGWTRAERIHVPEEAFHQTQRILRNHLRYVLDHAIRSTAFLDEVAKPL